MKIQDKKEKIDKNFDAKSMDFSIGDHSMVMGLIYDKLYADKILVPVQEYLSNARDAMREVKNKTDKIKVTLPTMKQPILKIRDYGPGLSPERVKEVFIQVGKSTKRNSNEQTGGFGIGAKSGFAYTKALVLISYYEGIETHYMLDVAEVKSGRLTVLEEKKTKEKNGVEIQIPVETQKNDEFNSESDISRFHRAVYRTICFWGLEKPEIVNEQEASEFANHYRELSDKFSANEDQLLENAFFSKRSSDSYYYSCSFEFVVDGIIYSLDEDLDFKVIADYAKTFSGISEVYFFVKNGVLEIAASREALVSTKENNQKLESIMKDTLKAYEKLLKKKASELKTLKEAFLFFDELKTYQGSALTGIQEIEGFKIDMFERTFILNSPSNQKVMTGIRAKESRRGSNIFLDETAAFVNALYVINDNDSALSSVKRKVKKLAEKEMTEKGIREVNVTVFPSIAEIESLPVIKLSEVREKRERKESNLGQSSQIMLDVAKAGTPGDRVSVSDLKSDTKFIEISQEVARRGRYYFGGLADIFDRSALNIMVTFPTKKAKKALTEGNFSLMSMEEFFKNISKILNKQEKGKLLKVVRLGIANEIRDAFNLDPEVLLKPGNLLDGDLVQFLSNLSLTNRDQKYIPSMFGRFLKVEAEDPFSNEIKFDFENPLVEWARNEDVQIKELIEGYKNFKEYYEKHVLSMRYDVEDENMVFMLNGIYVTNKKKVS